MTGAYIIAGLFALIGWFVSNRLRSKFKTYSEVRLTNGMSGRQIAEQMLADHGITDVQVISVRGMLTDHYNPAKKTVNLSSGVYDKVNAAAAAVAAHEVGHAVQHARSYRWLQMRSKLVPAVNISSKLVQWVLLGGILLVNSFPYLLLAGIGLFAVITLFSLVTLPVEYDASNRALAWMTDKGIVTATEHDGAEDALKWAARTYVVAALNSVATLVYYIYIYTSRRR